MSSPRKWLQPGDLAIVKDPQGQMWWKRITSPSEHAPKFPGTGWTLVPPVLEADLRAFQDFGEAPEV